ncbi:MAG: Fur family transcriptional regulator [Dehalococcoidia bacterium]|nr:Fur family transcriptional regulator [Dehalococcoidia bacterium]
MSATSDTEVTLRDMGCRLTPQRVMIVEAVRSSEGHVFADEIYQTVRYRYPHINISTVYRTLELLKGLGLITVTDLGEGKICYHWAEKGHHHHLVCHACGSVTALEDSVMDSLQTTLRERYGFRANLSHLAIFGWCANCAGEATGIASINDSNN